MTAIGIEIGRIVYARGELGKAAASRINVTLYREIGEIQFLPDVYAAAQSNASMNSAFLRNRHIEGTVTRISVNRASHQVSVTVAVDLSSLIPGVLPILGVFAITRIAQARFGDY